MEKPTVTIRHAQATDNVILAEMGARTFYETFVTENTPENMAAYLAKTYSPEIQAAEIDDLSTIILIAEAEGVAAGFAMLRTETREEGITGTRPMELVRIYTMQEWLGRGIGAALMQACLQEAQQQGSDSLWLGVWEHNPRARAFYQKWGFVEVGTHIFVVGDDAQTDILMQRYL